MKQLTLVLSVILCTSAPLHGRKDTQSVDFSRDVLPILSNKCFVCHGPSSEDPDQLRLDTEALATSDRGGYRAIDQAKPNKSAVLERLHSADEPMPPADAEKQLTDSERAILSAWVKQGGKYTKHWAFVAPVITPTKSAPDATGSAALDAYIKDALKAAKASLHKPADKTTIARRVSLVLTGLPPELDVLNAYLADDSDSAYETLVDTLLASPRYGEHQARFWLDAVRYGDTHGLHLDNRRGIYPYRDWVIGAMNDNLPLDTFIRWQLAGDLLPNPTLEQRVATGFVRMNPSTAEGGAIPAEFQAKNNFDRTETLGTVLLGMTLTCARCHTHKYDPITQTEYYQLFAFFNSTAENSMDGNSYTYAPILHAPKDQAGWIQWKQIERDRLALINTSDKDVRKSLAENEGALTAWNNGGLDEKLALLADPNGGLKDSTHHQKAVSIKAAIDAASKEFTTTLVTKDLDKPRETKILRRGEYNLPIGDALEPGVLSVMGTLPEDAPKNRLGLSDWLLSDEHPLVSRVLVNRIWQRVFGHAIVRTPEDFGLQGQHPTHPELLDWLAVELRQTDWNLKAMLKMMVMSDTFRQSSSRRRDLDDPENTLFGRGPSYRLDAEALRDIGLWSSGLMDPHMGGEGVKPYQPAGMWKALAHPGSNTKQYVQDKGALLYRRSIYIYWKRTSPHPMMTLFDAPDRESSCVRRARTNTALQSLGLLNEIQRIEMAHGVAERLLKQADSTEERLDLLFKLLTSRSPTKREAEACNTLLSIMLERFEAAPNDALELLAIGENTRDESLDAETLAAWTQIAVTVLASDPAILVY